MELFSYPFFQRALVAVILTGISCGFLGVWVFLLKISFLTVAISHAALAGGLLAICWGLPVTSVAMGFSIVTAGILGPLSERGRIHPETSIGVIFSTSLGLAFLLMGIVPEARTQGMNLLWGSLLTVGKTDLVVLGVITVIITVLAVGCFKEIHSVLFHQELAKSSGLAASLFFFLMLFFCGVGVSACLKSIGGLLVFSLILNPAAAAYQITYSLKKMYALSCLFSIASGVVGLAAATVFNLPAGASVVLVSSLIFFGCLAFCPKRRRKNND